MDGTVRILVIDDEKIEGDEVRYLLEGEGYEVDQALCGTEALSKIEQEQFDMILAGIPMPDTDELEMLRHIREASRDVTVIVMGDHASLEVAIKAWRCDISGYVPKPLDDPDKVLAAVAEGLADHKEMLRHRQASGSNGSGRADELEELCPGRQQYEATSMRATAVGASDLCELQRCHVRGGKTDGEF